MKSEFLKMCYSKWMLLVTALIPVFACGMLCLLPIHGVTGWELYGTKCLQSFYLTQNWFIVLAALYFGEEYKSGALRSTLMACPGRLRFLKEKTSCFFVWITLVLCIAIACSLIIILHYQDDIARTMWVHIGQVSLSILTLAGIAVALTIICRSGILSMAIGVALLMGAGHMLLQMSDIFMYLPGVCAMNAFYLNPMPGFLAIGEGLFCQGIWCVTLLCLAGYVFWRRSVR